MPWFLYAQATNSFRPFLSTTQFLNGGGVFERGLEALTGADFLDPFFPLVPLAFEDLVDDLRVFGEVEAISTNVRNLKGDRCF